MLATFRMIYLLMTASLKHPLTTAHLLPRASDFPSALRDGVKMYDLGFLYPMVTYVYNNIILVSS